MSKNIDIKQPTYKKAKFKVIKVENNALMISVNGWNMRVYSDKKIENKNQHIGKILELEYTGDIENPLKDIPKFKKISL